MDVGIVGVGTLGRKVAKELDRGAVAAVRVTALASRDLAKAEAFAATLASPPRVVSLAEMPSLCDLMIEVATADAVEAIVRVALEADTPVMVLSCGALLERDDWFTILVKLRALGAARLPKIRELLGRETDVYFVRSFDPSPGLTFLANTPSLRSV